MNSRRKGKEGEMKNNERWRPVVGLEGSYEVSDCGRVKSIPRTTTKGGLMNLHINGRNGYVYVPLYKNGRMYNKRVHILVMEAFTDYRSNGFDPFHVIDHIDGCKTNNHLSNLEVVTQAENDRRARLKKTQRYNGVEIIDLDSNQIYKNYNDAARSAGGSLGEMVARVCRGERSHYRGRHFAKYSDYVNGTIPEYKGGHTRGVSKSLWR